MEKKNKVRCTFELSDEEAKQVCDMRCESKPSTAAAQVVRLVLKKKTLHKAAEGLR